MTLTPEQLKSIKAGDVLEFAPGFRLPVTYAATWPDEQGIAVVYGEWGQYEYRCSGNGKNDGGCRVLDIISINPPEHPPGTVRVKIAVGVDAEACWRAYGGTYSPEGVSEHMAQLAVHSPCKVSWVYANVPLPEVSEIEGEVK